VAPVVGAAEGSGKDVGNEVGGALGAVVVVAEEGQLTALVPGITGAPLGPAAGCERMASERMIPIGPIKL
jgi:hypothetical protein